MRQCVKAYLQLKKEIKNGQNKYSNMAFMPYQISIWKKQLLDAAPAVLATEKIRMLRKKRLSELICIKMLAFCKSKLIG
jgi:hypothetical protein